LSGWGGGTTKAIKKIILKKEKKKRRTEGGQGTRQGGNLVKSKKTRRRKTATGATWKTKRKDPWGGGRVSCPRAKTSRREEKDGNRAQKPGDKIAGGKSSLGEQKKNALPVSENNRGGGAARGEGVPFDPREGPARSVAVPKEERNPSLALRGEVFD